MTRGNLEKYSDLPSALGPFWGKLLQLAGLGVIPPLHALSGNKPVWEQHRLTVRCLFRRGNGIVRRYWSDLLSDQLCFICVHV